MKTIRYSRVSTVHYWYRVVVWYFAYGNVLCSLNTILGIKVRCLIGTVFFQASISEGLVPLRLEISLRLINSVLEWAAL